MKFLNVAVLSSAAMMALVAPQATAADTKIYNGGECKVQLHGAAQYIPEGIENLQDFNCPPFGTDYEFVDCPIVRDNTGPTSGLDRIVTEFKNFNDGCNSPTTVSCTIYAMNKDANSGSYIDYVTGQSTTVGATQVSLSNLYTDLTTSDTEEGSYVLECFLGRYDYLTQISVFEH
jgi:hypothetical protein